MCVRLYIYIDICIDVCIYVWTHTTSQRFEITLIYSNGDPKLKNKTDLHKKAFFWGTQSELTL